MPLEHRASGLALDVVLGGPGLEELSLERAVPVDVAGTVVPFISPEDLVVTKLLAGRGKDIDDVRGVLAERGATLDVSRIRTTLGMLEGALGQATSRRYWSASWIAGGGPSRSGQARRQPPAGPDGGFDFGGGGAWGARYLVTALSSRLGAAQHLPQSFRDAMGGSDDRTPGFLGPAAPGPRGAALPAPGLSPIPFVSGTEIPKPKGPGRGPTTGLVPRRPSIPLRGRPPPPPPGGGPGPPFRV